MNTPTIVLTIAGSDSSGGAGIQADIKAISALGSFAASVITAVTAQNTLGVQGIHPIPTDMVTQQIRSVMDDLHPDAVKIGMVCDKGIASTIAACLDEYRPRWVVFDPVMVSTSGHKLMTDDIIETICRELLPKASLITPNLHEARIFLGHDVKDIEAMEVFFAQSYRCTVDSQNRIVIPPLLREFATLEKEVVIVGSNNVAKIWNAQRWAEKVATYMSPQKMKALARKVRL